MRILILSQYFQPEPIFKGLPLAKELQRRGHEVQVLTGFPNYPGGKIYDGYQIRLFQKETIDGIEVIRVPLFPSHNQRALSRVFNFISFGLSAALLGVWRVRQPDVVYAYNLVTLGPALRIFRWFRRSRTVLDVQDLWPESVLTSGMLKSNFWGRILRSVCNFEYRSQNHLICLSPGFKENLEQRGVPSTDISVVYNWCDEQPMVASINSSSQLRTPTQPFNIVFAGTMGIMQSLSTVIDCARLLEKDLPDVAFTFVGGGIEVDNLKTQACGLTNVHFLARVPPSEINTVLQSASALLVHLKDSPIFEVTIPSKIQAYLYVGKPILCGVKGDAKKLVEQSGGGLCFSPDDPHSLKAAIKKLYEFSKEDLDTMGLKGKEFYAEHLSFHKGMDKIEHILLSANSSTFTKLFN